MRCVRPMLYFALVPLVVIFFDPVKANPALPGEHPIIALPPPGGQATCPPRPGTPGEYGDANGGAGVSDFHYNIGYPVAPSVPPTTEPEDIEAPNGELQLWCMGDVAFALVWRDGSGDRGIIGKCPFYGGLNNKRYLADAGSAILFTIWDSTDGPDPRRPRGDDDQDDELDIWSYRYTVASDLLEQIHRENRIVQGDGFTSGAPKNSPNPFTLASLRPLTSRVDDPTAPGDHSQCAEDPTNPCGDGASMGDSPAQRDASDGCLTVGGLVFFDAPAIPSAHPVFGLVLFGAVAGWVFATRHRRAS
jgi:hypothetical protein